jgi:hypothetical protein
MLHMPLLQPSPIQRSRLLALLLPVAPGVLLSSPH